MTTSTGSALSIVFVIFPDVTQLDFTGPLQVLARVPGATSVIASPSGGPVRTDCGFSIAESVPLADVAACDVLLVPGGAGTEQVCGDAAALREVARLAGGARYVTSGLHRRAGSRRGRTAARQAGEHSLGVARHTRGVRRDARSGARRA